MSPARRISDVGLVVVLVACAAAAAAALWTRPGLLTLVLLPLCVPLVLRIEAPRLALVLVATGVVLGPATEALCVAGGLWRYAATGGVPLVPLWIFPLWACFLPALWLVLQAIWGRPPTPRASPVTLLWALLGLLVEVSLFVRLGDRPMLALGAGLALGTAVLAAARRPTLPLVFLAGAVLGPLCEAWPASAGAFRYATPALFGLPLWLPMAYGVFSSLLWLAGESLVRLAVRSDALPHGGHGASTPGLEMTR